MNAEGGSEKSEKNKSQTEFTDFACLSEAMGEDDLRLRRIP